MQNDLFRNELDSMKPYVPGKPIEEVRREYGLQRVEKLASNENPLGPSPLAVEAARAELGNLHLYPDPSAAELRKAIAAANGVGPECVVVANGGEHLLQMIAMAFVNAQDEAIMAYPTFDVYASSVTHMGGVPVTLPLVKAPGGYGQDPSRFLDRITSSTKLAYVCNPNNPTAMIETRAGLREFYDNAPDRVVLVVDEAYCDYARDDPRYPDGVELLKVRPNTIVLRTFSKISGLAGLRCGYVITSPAIAAALAKVRGTFVANRVAQAAALAALGDGEHRARTLALNAASLAMMNEYFDRRGFERVQSRANFVFANVGKDSRDVFEVLLRRGVVIRPGAIWGWDDWIRVSSGTLEQTAYFIETLGALL